MFGWFSKKQEPKAASLENPSTPLSEPDVWLTDALGGSMASSGMVVNKDSALRCSAVFACVRLLSETVAGLPYVIYERKGKEVHEVDDHPLYPLLNVAPNEMMTAFTWKDMQMNHGLLAGNSYSVIRRTVGGRVIGFVPLMPDSITVVRNKGRLFYRARLVGGSEEVFSSDDILHTPGPGWDGITGYSPISILRNSVGIALATEDHGARLFSNGTNLGMTLETDQSIDPDRQKEILKLFNEKFRGTQNANKTAILVSGLKAKTVGMSSEDAQFLETRKFQVNDIARIFNVPPHMIGDLEKSSFNNIEQQNINFLMYSVRPWLERIESEINRKLFSGSGYFVAFNADNLLRGDFKTRSEGLTRFVNGAIMTPNEARKREGLNPIEGGDELRVPLNTAPISESTTQDQE